MRKSDPTTPKSIVIAFPKQTLKRPSATTAHAQKLAVLALKGRLSKSSAELHPPLHASTPNDVLQQHCRRLEILTTKGNPTPELIDELAPGLVRNILRRVGSGKCTKTNLPKQLRRRLDLMCQFKHPAALILKDWFDGNRGILPPNLQTIADYSTCSQEQE